MKMDIEKALKLCEKYELRSIRELRVFIHIAKYSDDTPVTLNDLMKKTGYPRSSVKKVIYKLGCGRESGYHGYLLVTFVDSLQTGGRTKVVKMTRRGQQFAKKLLKLI